MAIPQLTEQSVGVPGLPTPMGSAQAAPAAFGAGVGQAIQAGAQELGQIAHERRKMDASFAAADTSLRYGDELDATVEQYKNDLKNLQVEQGGDYSAAVRKLQADYAPKIEALRKKHADTLSDPLALKTFDIRTRLETQAAARHMLVTADHQIDVWQGKVADGAEYSAVKAAGNVTGNTEQDTKMLAEIAGSRFGVISDYLKTRTTPPEEIQKKLGVIESKMVQQALTTYGNDYAAGERLLASKIGDVRVGFDKDHPDAPSVLSGAETQKWRDQFTDAKAASTRGASADVGLAFAANNWLGKSSTAMEAAARKQFLSGPSPDPIAYDSAVTHAAKYRGEAHAAEEQARSEQTHAAANAIVKEGLSATEALARYPKADASSLLGADARYSAYATKPLVAAVNTAFADPRNAGFSAALPKSDLSAALYGAGVPESQIRNVMRAYDKDAHQIAAVERSPGTNLALSNARDAVRQLFHVSQITGKGLSDLKPWQQDVLTAAEIEITHRISGATPKAGTTTIPQDEALKIGSDVIATLPDLKRRAERGEKVVPDYPVKPREATPEQTQAAARVLSALRGPQAAPTVQKITGPDPRIPGSEAGQEYESVIGTDGKLAGYRRTK
jgi:hypothetical protein